MAPSVIWSSSALEDFEAVTAFIAKDSAHYAASFAGEVLEASRALSHLQNRGRIVPEFALADIREFFVRDFRLIYRAREKKFKFLGSSMAQGIFWVFGLLGKVKGVGYSNFGLADRSALFVFPRLLC